MISFFVATLAVSVGGATARATAETRGSPESMCKPGEVAVFACPIGRKVVAVCMGTGASANTAAYRFGTPGRVELEARDLTHASRGYSGGGETQISLARGDYRYTLYDNMTRTGFGADGRNDSQMTTGLIVQRGGKTLSDRRCGGAETVMLSQAAARLPPGEFVEHDLSMGPRARKRERPNASAR